MRTIRKARNTAIDAPPPSHSRKYWEQSDFSLRKQPNVAMVPVNWPVFRSVMRMSTPLTMTMTKSNTLAADIAYL